MTSRGNYIVSATDSAGTEFELGTEDQALRALALVRGAEARLLGARVRVRLADGSDLDREELTARAAFEVQQIAFARTRAERPDGEPD